MGGAGRRRGGESGERRGGGVGVGSAAAAASWMSRGMTMAGTGWPPLQLE